MPEIGKILRGLGGALDSTGRTNQLNAALIERSRLEEAREEELKREELESVVNDLSKQESEMIGAIQKLPQGDPRIPLLNTALQNVQAKKTELGASVSNVPAIGLGDPKTNKNKASFVVSWDDPRNEKFNLGIPKGERARVEFDLDSEGKPISASVQGRFGAATRIENKINLPEGESKFQEELGKAKSGQVMAHIEAGNNAANLESELFQLSELVSTTDFQSGKLQPFITSVQGIFADLGVDVDEVAKSLGIDNIGKLETKEQANRLFNRVVLDNFEKIKGNLNAQEVKIAKSTFGDIGDSEEANIDAIAASMASNQIARETAVEANKVDTKDDADALNVRINERGTKRFEELKKQFKEKMIASRSNNGEIPKAAIERGINKDVWDELPDSVKDQLRKESE